MFFLHPSGMAGRPWSEREIAVLREGYGVVDPEVLLEALPGRTWDSVKLTASRYGVSSASKPARPWEHEELRTLREFWQLVDPEDLLAKLPGRTWDAVRKKADALGLQIGIPQGYAAPHALALELGLDVSTLLRILKLYVVPIRVPYPQDLEATTERFRHRMVDRFLAQGAVRLYVYDWTVPKAAVALGLSEQVFRKRLRARGYHPRGSDGPFAADPVFWRAIANNSPMIEVDVAAERVMRVEAKSMRQILRSTNVPMSDQNTIPSEVLPELKAVLASRRERSGILF